VADLPENPGTEGSSQSPSGTPAPPPFQPVATSYQPVTTPSQATGVPPPPAPPKSGGSSALKIILIILGVLVLLMVLVAGVIGYGIYRVKKAFHTDARTGETTIATPGGAITANSNMKFTSDELGTDVYPGAEPAKSGNLRMNLAGNSVVSASFLTSDSKDKVVAFYKDKLGSEATSMEFASNAILSLKKGANEVVQVSVSQEPNQHDGKTQIHISHTTSSQAK
jgi:hypothetical protein